MVNHYVHPAANPEWRDLHKELPPLPAPKVREDANRRTLVGVGMAATSYLFVSHADRIMREIAAESMRSLRRMVNYRCGVELSDSNWEKLRRSAEWRRVSAASKLSMMELMGRMPWQVVEHFLGLFGASLGMGMATSSAAKSNGMPAAEGMGLMTGLAVFGTGLFAGEGRVFTPLMHDLARPPASAVNEQICLRARRLAGVPLPEGSRSYETSSLPERAPATALADKAFLASLALMAARGAAQFGSWLGTIFSTAEPAAIPVPMLMIVPPGMSLENLFSFDIFPEDA